MLKGNEVYLAYQGQFIDKKQLWSPGRSRNHDRLLSSRIVNALTTDLQEKSCRIGVIMW